MIAKNLPTINSIAVKPKRRKLSKTTGVVIGHGFGISEGLMVAKMEAEVGF